MHHAFVNFKLHFYLSNLFILIHFSILCGFERALMEGGGDHRPEKR